eukprot:13794812-Ditylum_brightwellii.AAC.1
MGGEAVYFPPKLEVPVKRPGSNAKDQAKDPHDPMSSGPCRNQTKTIFGIQKALPTCSLVDFPDGIIVPPQGSMCIIYIFKPLQQPNKRLAAKASDSDHTGIIPEKHTFCHRE